MNKQEFKIWLATNNYSQASLARELGINKDTIGNYVRNERFPRVFIYALHGLSLIKLTNSEFEAIKHLLTQSQIKRIEIVEE